MENRQCIPAVAAAETGITHANTTYGSSTNPAPAIRLRHSITCTIPVHQNAVGSLNCYPAFLGSGVKLACRKLGCRFRHYIEGNYGGFRLVWISDVWPHLNAGSTLLRRAQFGHLFQPTPSHGPSPGEAAAHLPARQPGS